MSRGMQTTSPLDADELARWLEPRVASLRPRGYLAGKTALRNLLYDELGLSLLECEQAIDTLEARGMLTFTGTPQAAARPSAGWRVSY